MSANVWNPGVNTVPLYNANGLIKTESQEANIAQRSFALTAFAYTVGTGSLLVYKNGKHLVKNKDYFEVDITTVLLAEACALGDEVTFVAFLGITGVVGLDAQLRQDLFANSGSNIVNFMQAGLGAYMHSVQTKLREHVSVFDFMSEDQINDVKNKTKLYDHTAVIKNALAAHLNVYFPNGVYLTSSTLNLRSNQRISFGPDAAIFANADNFSIFTGVTQTGVSFGAPAFNYNGHVNIIGIDFTAMQTGCRIEYPVIVGNMKGILFRQNCYGIPIIRPVGWQCPTPIEFGYSCNGNSIMTPEFNNLTAIGGTGTGIGINFNDAAVGANTIFGGGYIQGFDYGVYDKGNGNVINGVLYLEKCNEAHIFYDGATHCKVDSSLHYAQNTKACIKARNTAAIYVRVPVMTPGNVSVGLFDVDATNTNFKVEMNNSAGFNTPLGIVTGVTFTEEDGGTSTLSFAGSTAVGAVAYNYNKMDFKRREHICWINAAVNWNNFTGTGEFRISNLPYPATGNWGLNMLNCRLTGPNIAFQQINAQFVSPTEIVIRVTNAGVDSNIQCAQVSGGDLQISGFYFC